MRLAWVLVLVTAAPSVMAEAPPTPNSAPPPRLTVENINKTTAIIRDPTIAVDNALQTLTPMAKQAASTAAETVDKVTPDMGQKRITDPTQMTGSFSQALSRITAKVGTQGATPAAATAVAPQLPIIRLSAKSIGQNKKAAMVNVAGANHLIREGSMLSFLENNLLYEIKVNKISHDQVEITLLPMGKVITLE